MGPFFWTILLAILIPLAEGVLLALLLREVHVRHPLPLIEPGYVNAWIGQEPKNTIARTAEERKTSDKSVGDGTGNSEEGTGGEDVFAPGEVSIFDGSVSIPKDLPINDVLDSMVATVSEKIPDAFESRIEESTCLQGGLPHEMRHIGDDLDFDDMQDLAAALPNTKIDFAQDLDTDSGVHEPISPMAKELLGEDFDFDALEQQAAAAARAPTDNILEEVASDVQKALTEIEPTSSLFHQTDLPSLADFATPQMVLSTFSGDWVQEAGNTIEPIVGDTSNFCFTAESQPMFVRKRKAN